jgi:formylglycine-generating enzyme required for sulfatase activity
VGEQVAGPVRKSSEASLVEIPQMLYVPDGLFWMGSDERDLEAAANERPRHREYLPAYFVGKYAVTNAQYGTFVRATGYPVPVHWVNGRIPPGIENHPVVNVSYSDAYAYCHWLTEVIGEAYHLPTEYQWEKAARGGEPEGRRYPWGDGWVPGYCNSAEEGWQDTTTVNRYEWHNCSPHGVVDMVGNVWEWTDSLYHPYPNSTHYSTVCKDTYVVRGGSWKNARQDARVSVRGRYKPSVRRPYLGFRVARQVGRSGL